MGSSGGEKEKDGDSQMLTPAKAFYVDETDSGLDVDAVKLSRRVSANLKRGQRAPLIITHNAKILEDGRWIFCTCWPAAKLLRLAARN